MGELNIDDLENIPAGGETPEEADKLEGSKPLIANVTTEEYDSKFDVDPHSKTRGQELPEGQTMKAWRVVIDTAPYGEDLIGRNVITTQRVNLKINPTSGNWGPSLHEKAKSKKLFVKLGVDNFKDMIGKPITVFKNLSEDGKRAWMTFGI